MGLTIKPSSDAGHVDIQFDYNYEHDQEYEPKSAEPEIYSSENWNKTKETQGTPDKIGNIKVDVRGVKGYTKWWGRLLCELGYASHIAGSGKCEDIYVNTKSFLRHLSEAWYNAGNRNSKFQDKTLVDKISEKIQSDAEIDKSELTAEKVVEIFKKFG